MTEHPIQGLMKTAMENIKEMVDVNTIVGDPVETPDGSVIMPISKVGFGFAAGGSEFVTADEPHAPGITRHEAHNASVSLPFGGGSGGGVSITPIAFLVVGKQGVKIVPLDNQTHLLERLIDSAPQVVDRIQSMMKNGSSKSGASDASASAASGSTTVTNNIENQNFIV
ncbi:MULTISPECIES: GerW family sporulation protein [Paenibacillus]|uniref:GerW family sporulation protein n=1 Tax=Paenibacillus TaxID=44249 RepID=UPI0022B92DD4|nr:GerW family sporulation protein [Paenibacillus caseinilyticus]MCZ8520587.1 GerW family sporulation protein [Paenibacillus caseinilyticus]